MLVKFGNWLFHYRNILFPIFYAALFIPSLPIFPDYRWSIIPGSLFIALGIVTRGVTIGLVYIVRGGNKRQIHADTLVTGGVYQICRNPMYLGNILLIIGFGLFANSLLFLTLFSSLFVLFYIAIIRAEENFLLTKFGGQFEAYKSFSNALLPKLSRLKNAFSSHRFDFKRVINKEHNSLFLYFSGVLLLLWYQHLISWRVLLFIFSPLLIIYLYVKWLKKEKKL